MALADLGLIGNCQLSALVRCDGAIVWSCMPRFDAPPLLGALLDEREGGRFAISPADERRGIRDEVLREAVEPTRGCLVADYGGKEVDASLLQAVMLRLLPPSDARMRATVDAVRADLDHYGWVKRYRTNDGFGVPAVAFTLCTFWLVEALATLGRTREASALMDRVRSVKSPLGLLSEDVDPVAGVMWGNFPQAYSHVGLIHAAFAAAPRWSEFGI